MRVRVCVCALHWYLQHHKVMARKENSNIQIISNVSASHLQLALNKNSQSLLSPPLSLPHGGVCTRISWNLIHWCFDLNYFHNFFKEPMPMTRYKFGFVYPLYAIKTKEKSEMHWKTHTHTLAQVVKCMQHTSLRSPIYVCATVTVWWTLGAPEWTRLWVKCMQKCIKNEISDVRMCVIVYFCMEKLAPTWISVRSLRCIGLPFNNVWIERIRFTHTSKNTLSMPNQQTHNLFQIRHAFYEWTSV